MLEPKAGGHACSSGSSTVHGGSRQERASKQLLQRRPLMRTLGTLHWLDLTTFVGAAVNILSGQQQDFGH